MKAFNKEKAPVFNFHCGCRIYDKEGNGYITTETLRGLIGELLAPLTEEELEGILTRDAPMDLKEPPRDPGKLGFPRGSPIYPPLGESF